MLKESGYGVQEDVYEELHNIGCKQIVILEQDTGMRYVFGMGDLYRAKPKDYGNGYQRFLSIVPPNTNGQLVFDFEST